MERRDFIKNTCLTCASVVGGSALLNLLSSCSPLQSLTVTSKDNVMLIPESSFKEEQNVLIVKNTQLDYDILLVKKKDNTYTALYMQCSHENQPLNATKTGLFCSTHGSAFDLEGNVTVQPATKKLKQFKTSLNNNTISINLN